MRSMSRKGYSPDNAACEGFFGRLKIEMFFSRDWLSTSIEEFVAALDAYIRWYVSVRPSHLAITHCAKDARVRFTSSRTHGHFEH